jgi:peptide/nickel transport system ATP-binding protein
MNTIEPVLSVHNLSVEYPTRGGSIKALSDVSFEIPRGSVVGIVGESGCGKSTLAKACIGLLDAPGRVTSGHIRVAGGADVVRMQGRAVRRIRGRTIGYVAQNPFGSLNPVLRVADHFRSMHRAHHGRQEQSATILARAAERLDAVGITDPPGVLRAYPHELSGGMAQRVVIAIASFLDPVLLLADEPTTGLDLTVQRQVLELLCRDVTNVQAVAVVTHDLGVVAQYCEQVIVMYAGRVVETGPVAAVFNDPAHPYTDALLGSIPRKGHELKRLRGGMPNLIDYPTGCPFQARCDFAVEDCSTAPIPRQLPHDRQVACHLDRVATSAEG